MFYEVEFYSSDEKIKARKFKQFAKCQIGNKLWESL